MDSVMPPGHMPRFHALTLAQAPSSAVSSIVPMLNCGETPPHSPPRRPRYPHRKPVDARHASDSEIAA
jgi:hypothetical protein